MTTACPDCRARIVARAHLARPGDSPLFAETCACGAVHLWGLVECEDRTTSDRLVRPCQREPR